MWLIFSIIWYIVGFSGWICTIRENEDFTVKSLAWTLFASIFGPIIWILHLYFKYEDRTIFKRKEED